MDSSVWPIIGDVSNSPMVQSQNGICKKRMKKQMPTFWVGCLQSKRLRKRLTRKKNFANLNVNCHPVFFFLSLSLRLLLALFLSLSLSLFISVYFSLYLSLSFCLSHSAPQTPPASRRTIPLFWFVCDVCLMKISICLIIMHFQ